jgi:hypothetical protein
LILDWGFWIGGIALLYPSLEGDMWDYPDEIKLRLRLMQPKTAGVKDIRSAVE